MDCYGGPRYVASIRSQAFRVYVVARGGVASNADSPPPSFPRGSLFSSPTFLRTNSGQLANRDRLARRSRIEEDLSSRQFFFLVTRSRGLSYMRFNIHEFVGRLIDTSNGSLAPGALLGGRQGGEDLHNLYLAIVNIGD